MRKKKIIVVMASIFSLAVSMTACSGKDEKKSSGEKVVLRILENDTAKEEGYLDELISAFNEKYKDQGIEAVDANMDEFSDLAANGPYGYGPDVLYQANDKLMTYAEDKHILAINPEDYECYGTTAKEAWSAFDISIDGKTYTCGIPVNVQEPMLFYREDLIPENWESEWDKNSNQVPDFFENWNDLYKLSKQLRDSDTSANKDEKFGFMSSFNNLYLNANFFLSYGAYIFGKDDAGIYDSSDIGFAKGDAANGIQALIQFASVMDEGCIDDTIITNRYDKLGNGSYFCSVSTPDTYSLFIAKLALHYEEDGLSETEANEKARENLKMIELPALMPADGDLSKDSSTMKDSDWVKTVVMGGVNGYGISSYTEHRDEAKLFVDFATSYEMINKRTQILGIAPTRSDVAKENGGTADTIFASLESGRIMLMPSIKAVDQIWKPVQTLMGDFAKEPFRSDAEKKYAKKDDINTALEKASKDIYDAIYTLSDK